jgi:hypothetical protein
VKIHEFLFVTIDYTIANRFSIPTLVPLGKRSQQASYLCPHLRILQLVLGYISNKPLSMGRLRHDFSGKAHRKGRFLRTRYKKDSNFGC